MLSPLFIQPEICPFGKVMMAHERCGEEDAEAILSNLKMEGRSSLQIRSCSNWLHSIQ